MEKLRVESMVLGMVSTNCYLVINAETGQVVIIDPAAEADRILRRIGELKGKPEAILLTHGHFDHIGAADELRRALKIPVLALEEEKEILEDVEKNLSGFYGEGYTVTPNRFLRDGEVLALLGSSVQVIHTPGHTLGGACYYLAREGILFSGDTLFCGSVGRTDFPTGSMTRLHESIHARLFVLPEETVVYPGHGEQTDISYEKRYNPY